MRHYILLAGIFSLPLAATAQHGGAASQATPPNIVAPREATQWDFLVGQWELDVRPVVNTLAARIHGAPKMVGSWKAWRALDGWGIEDDLRINDNSGNPHLFSHSVRVFDAAARRWNCSALDVYRGTFVVSTAAWERNRMVVTSSGVTADGTPYLVRITYSDLTPTSFTFLQERSTDSGKTWSDNLRMRARRVAATAPR